MKTIMEYDKPKLSSYARDNNTLKHPIGSGKGALPRIPRCSLGCPIYLPSRLSTTAPIKSIESRL